MRLRLKSVDATAAARIAIVAGTFLSPSFFDLGSVKPFDVPKVAVLWFFGWLAFGLTMIEMLRGQLRPARFRLARIAGAFLLAAGIATLFSHTRTVSFFGWYARYGGFVEILLYVVIFWSIVQLYWRRPDRLKEIFAAVALASIVLAGYVLVQYVHLDPIKWVQPSGRATFRYFGTMGNSDFAGGYLGASFGWLVYAFWRARRVLVRVLVVAWAFVTLFALWETSSRGGLVALFASACVGLFVFRRRIPRVLTGLGALVAAAVVVAALAAAFGAKPRSAPAPSPAPKGSVSAAPSVLRTNTFVIRMYWWKAAARIFASRPLVGTGPDTFVVEYPHYALAAAAKQPGTERTDEPHNIFIDHAISTGILGIGAYLALIFLAFRWGLRRLRDIERPGADRTESDLLACFLVVAAGYLGQGFFSIDVAALAALGWVSFAGIAALADPLLVARRGRLAFGEQMRSRSAGFGRRAAAAATAVAVAVVMVIGLRPWLADRAARQAARDASNTDSTDIVMRSYQRAMALAPYDPVYRGLAANFLTQQALAMDDKDVEADLLGQAVDLEKQMDQMQPGNAFWKTTIGSGLAALGSVTGDVSNYEESEAWFSDAAKAAPNDYRVSLQHGVMLNKWGRATHDGLKYCEAVSEFRHSNSLRRQSETYTGLGEAYAAIGHIDQSLDALHAAQQMDPSNKDIPTLISKVEALRKNVKVINCS
jgi:O-antigen ligase/tetratricopeptide (TPR) repeat protein